MKTIPKKTAEEIIERLAKKGDCLNCDANGLVSDCGDTCQYPYHCPICLGEKKGVRTMPVMIGDVLAKISQNLDTVNNGEFECLEECLRLWFYCLPFDKSLQEIIDKQPEELSKEASDLFLFLNEIL